MELPPLKLFTRKVNEALDEHPSLLVTCTKTTAPSVKVVLDSDESKLLVLTPAVCKEPLMKN